MSHIVKKKKAISGFIEPRWPKERVVTWLEIGAVPAIVGLWFPDWIGSYAKESTTYLQLLLPPLPPLLTYIGALILLKACYEGIFNMGSHFKGLVISGSVCVTFAVASFIVQLFGLSLLSLLFTGLAAFFAAGFFWFTIGKVWEISQEKRTYVTWHSVWISNLISLAVYLYAIGLLYYEDQENGFVWLRIGIVLFTITFAFCRYAVYCYKTQTSIGARFQESPDKQFWVSADS